MRTLYIVSTPIGNRKDITLRAIEVLKKVDIILAEDTMKTSNLLQTYPETSNLNKKIIPYHKQNRVNKLPEVIAYLKNGKQIALVSNAGTPLVADPGYKLVKECLRLGIKVVSVPGPSAFLTALVSSGLPTNEFLFIGFLSKKNKQIKDKFKEIKNNTYLSGKTIIFYETPHRLVKTLSIVKQIYGDIEIVLGRELTKKFEEVVKREISYYLDKYKTENIKGEFVVLFKLP